MKKSTEAREKNTQGTELEAIKLATVNAIASDLTGLVNSDVLKEELIGIVEDEGRLRIATDNYPWIVTGNTGVKYRIKNNGIVELVSGLTLSTNKVNFKTTGEKKEETLIATLSPDLIGKIVEWSIPENNGVARISATSEGRITIE